MLVNISDIREREKALRTVNPKTESYLQLVDSVKEHGVINAIALRKCVDGEGNEYLEIVDGLHRFSAAKDAGLEQIPATIQENMSEMEVLQQQIIGNIHKIETKPVEYSRQLIEILGLQPTLTAQSLAAQLGKSKQWLDERLKLVDLTPNLSALVDEGKINLSNAYALAKLPQDKQEDYVTQAQTQSPAQFVNEINTIRKELEKARKQGREASDVFVPTAYLRKLSELKDEHEKATAGPSLCHKKGLPDSARNGFALGVAWALHLDEETVEAAKKEHTEKVVKVKESREIARKDRMEKTREAYKLKAERSQLAADEVNAGRDPKDALDAFDQKNQLGKYKPKKEETSTTESN